MTISLINNVHPKLNLSQKKAECALARNEIAEKNLEVSTETAAGKTHAVVFTSKTKQGGGKDQIAFGGGPGDQKTIQWAADLGRKAANTKIAEGVLKSGAFQWMAGMAKTSPAVLENAVLTLALSMTARPLCTMLMPGQAKMDDRKVSAARSIATGIVGAGFAVAAMQPIANAVDKVLEKKGLVGEGLSKANQLKGDTIGYLGKYGCKILLALPTAMLLFTIIPPIMEFMFPKKKGDPKFNPNPTPFAAKLDSGTTSVRGNNEIESFKKSLQTSVIGENTNQKGLR